MPEGENHEEKVEVDGKILLNWILENRMGGCGIDSSGSG
jgi:hypothetical protein